MIKYHWQITPEIRSLLDQINALKIVVATYPFRPEILDHLRRHSLLKSAVFSARVENIPARLEDPGVHRKIEIQNLISAYTRIFSHSDPKKLSLNLIRRFHQLTLKNLSASAGQFRTEPWAIFNQAGVAVYLAPAHFNLPQLMPEYIKFINSLKESAPVIAAIAQFIFEKIHPFADGNGRVGRLISAFILNRTGFGLNGLAAFEEYTDTHKSVYYQALESNTNCTPFIEYFLRSVVESTRSVLSQITQINSPRTEDLLLPRRQEILAIIRDHPNCSFNFLSRRFPTINASTLHYDLQQLNKAGLILKRGSTRATVYSSTA